MEALLGLPDRGVFGVVEGWRPLQQAPPATYICCHDTTPPDDRVVRNAVQKLSDLYRGAQKRHAAHLASKRHARHLPDGSRGIKRHQTDSPSDQEAAAARAAGTGAGSALDDVLKSLSVPNLPAAAKASSSAAAAAKAHNQQHQPQPFRAAPAGNQQQLQHKQQSRAPLAAEPLASGTQHSSHARAADPGSGSGSSRQAVFSHEQLKAKTNRELVELLKARSCPVSGKKDELVRRIMDYQFRLRRAAQGSMRA